MRYRERHWSTSSDTLKESVWKSITGNRFREHFNSNVHIRGNSDTDKDRNYKARYLFEILNVSFKKFVSANNYCIDENIIPYYGRVEW